MLYLIAAVLSSATFSTLLRFAENRVRNRFALIAGNYLSCSMIGAVFLAAGSGFPEERLPFTLLFGAVSGFMYMGTLLLLQKTISGSGLVLASVFNKLGVLIPVLLALILFRELPSVWQAIGFVLSLAAVVWIFTGGTKAGQGGKPSGKSIRAWIRPVCLLVTAGLTDSMVNLFDKYGPVSGKDAYLFLNFFFAFFISLTILLIRIKAHPVRLTEVLLGAAAGVPIYFASRFVLKSLGGLPSVVVYPVYCVGTLAVITLAGLVLFRERLSARKWIGVGLILVALVLLNL